jgi:hypothetical protein
MKVNEGERIPGFENNVYGPDEEVQKTVSELSEEYFTGAYDNSWLSDVFNRVDATNIDDNVYDSAGTFVTFDKYARACDLRDGWTGEWIELIVSSIEDEVISQIRDRFTVVHNEDMDTRDIEEHFQDEYAWSNAEMFRVKPDIHLYLSPETFGYNVVRTEFDATHRYGMGSDARHSGVS